MTADRILTGKNEILFLGKEVTHYDVKWVLSECKRIAVQIRIYSLEAYGAVATPSVTESITKFRIPLQKILSDPSRPA